MEKTDEHLGSDYSLHRLQQKQACLSSAKENVIREDADSVGHMKLPLSVVLFPRKSSPVILRWTQFQTN